MSLSSQEMSVPARDGLTVKRTLCAGARGACTPVAIPAHHYPGTPHSSLPLVR
jgi:hypothetical protein